jgi:hypothetical protein
MGKLITNTRIDLLLRQGLVEEALREPIKQPNPRSSGIRTFVESRASHRVPFAEDAAYAGLTLGDFLYDYIRIDPEVVRGIEFARAGDINGVLSFAHFAETKADLRGAGLDGLHSELQGYVAEQIEAHHLVAQGHDVVFPDTPNNPGWDLKVDGHPFQVKCLADSGGVVEHLHRYPDIPVIVNSELADKVGDHAGVYVDSALHHDAVRQATEDALDRGRDLADFEIPWISIAVSGAFNLCYMVTRGTDVQAFLACTATDSAARIAGGEVGKCIGAGVGLLLFGPAGAIVVGAAGAVVGSSGGRRAMGRTRRLFVAREATGVRDSVRRVAGTAAEAVPEKLRAWRRKSELVADSLSGGKPNQAKVQAAMARRFGDSIGHWTRKKAEIEALACGRTGDPGWLFEQLLTLIRRGGIHAHHIQEPMEELAKRMREYSDQCRRFRTA